MIDTTKRRCEMFCTRVLAPGDNFGTDEIKACCRDCAALLRLLSHEVLPAIRKYGYWSPPQAPLETELAAVIDQHHLRQRLIELMDGMGFEV